MTSPRRHPVYCRWHENLPTHPKTLAAARVLAREVAVDVDHAVALVCRAVPALVCWLIRERDDGRTDGLTDAHLAAICWPASMQPGGRLWGADERAVGVWRRALRAVPDGYRQGFLVEQGQGRGRPKAEGLHEFVHHAWPALRKRPHYSGLKLSDVLAQGVLHCAGRSRRFEGPSEPVLPGFSTPSSDASPDPFSAPGPAENSGSKDAELAPPGRPSIQAQAEEGKDLPGDGWRGVPGGVRRGELLAVAELIRCLHPNSRAGLRTGSAYLDRYREAAFAPIRQEALDVSPLLPGRLFEVLEPEQFAALVGDLASRTASMKHPRTYCARSLAGRWAEVLGALQDRRQAERGDAARLGRKAGGEAAV